jgi:Plasmid pRiA4b ORF-3-like protein
MAMTTATSTDQSRVFELEITLLGTNPRVWRRIQVREFTTLLELHDIIQCSMGWEDSHCHKFNFPRGTAMTFDDDEDDNDDDFDESDPRGTSHKEVKQTLSQVVTGKKFRFLYTYDYGDNWEHGLEVTKILPRGDINVTYPDCIAGENACPPEDSGGVSRYQRAPNFDPQHFDLAAVNAKLTALYE